jgi:hypothetical protein
MPFTFPCRRGDAEFNAFGDLLTTLSGEAMPIQWIGRRVYKRSTGTRYPESVLPVRVPSGALGPGEPRCDLFIVGRSSPFSEEMGESRKSNLWGIKADTPRREVHVTSDLKVGPAEF